MAEVTKELVTRINDGCVGLGWENDIAHQVVGVQFCEKCHMSITYQAIADLMELYSLATPTDALKWSLQESQVVPAVEAGDIMDYPVVTDVASSSLVVGEKFIPSTSEKTVIEAAKDGDCVWVCELCADDSVKRVPVVVRIS